MKREHFSLNAIPDPTATGQPPTIEITYDGPTESLHDRLSTPGGDRRGAEDVDVAYRLRDEQRGVLGISDRFTGAFVCEMDADAEVVTDIVSAAENDDGRYCIEIGGGKDIWSVEKRTLLVYDGDGRLLRTCSLIPGSVEL
ncbi:DUF5793 family protein [Halorhabdus amylolytica]|uniref:DUF5793 family protein n=1 Tax=Halorhabdus amylolytica TaxID=2559573 RepID=UPI0010AB3640|nr:DUF5793 family protein [Halorhabdus amylolytica]